MDPELVSAWTGADVKGLVETTTRLPALVVNDAIVTAAGVITGNGSELVLTFGTGLGVAFAVDGTLTEHIEVSHAPSPLGGTFDDTVGAINVSGADPALWSENILRVIDSCGPCTAGISSTLAEGTPLSSLRLCGRDWPMPASNSLTTKRGRAAELPPGST